ncbi:thiamine phosphate synthase [Fructilactobacillus lindneri]|nr:thiamine phosphate synthase [Fructilactobacillus lindneri]ANZ57772.1 hypothetical protein AYR60_02825 [Fructilactobacillus lindneri]ANZ59041.1 hypothetical protein AYR59_02825 [Fructilactobacillus lindneri]SJZ86410.1 thiamine-phosphate pyrophosphorylase [Fructilactobacillus lindneri DSM 20690 = JCM 11027]
MMKFNPQMLQVYLVIGTQNTNNDPQRLLKIVKEALAAGVTAVQYREKDGTTLTKAEKVALGRQLHQITQAKQVPLFVDDDYELARTIGAEGIHVGQSDTRADVIHQLAPDLMMGLSVHNLEELERSRSLLPVVDYLGVGPIFATASKIKVKDPIGMQGLDDVITQTSKPVVAIGGIHENNVTDFKTEKVTGVAVISAITKSSDIKNTVQILKQRGK